jgi:hypothetical protein
MTDVDLLLCAVAAGAAAIAVWIDFRLRRFAPEAPVRVFLHFAVSYALGWAIGPLMAEAVSRGLAPGAALLTCALPTLVYMLLATLWLLRLAQSVLHGARG